MLFELSCSLISGSSILKARKQTKVNTLRLDFYFEHVPSHMSLEAGTFQIRNLLLGRRWDLTAGMLDQSASVQERYELKFLVSLEAMVAISEFVEKYCAMDPYSENAPDHFYISNNLYLDNKNLQLYKKNEGEGSFSFNMRIRSYGMDPQAPYYFEIKYKVRDFVRKKRSRVLARDWAGLLSAEDFSGEMEMEARKNLEEFIFLSRSYACAPVLNVQYRRKAYFSLGSEYARVTFDRDIRYQKTNEWLYQTEELSSFEEKVILELKYEKKMPAWMKVLISEFELTQTAGAKYGSLLPSWAGSEYLPDENLQI